MTPTERSETRTFKCGTCGQKWTVNGRWLNGSWTPYEPALWERTKKTHSARDGGTIS